MSYTINTLSELKELSKRIVMSTQILPSSASDQSSSSDDQNKSDLKQEKQEKEVSLLPSEIIDQSWTIYDIGTNPKTVPKSWESVFQSCQQCFKEIDYILSKEMMPVLPYRKHIFRVFELCKLDKIKVVIIGQDPYPNLDPDSHPTAQGLSFSVRKESPIPSSLKNIFKELTQTVPGYRQPLHGDLTSWVEQGVFLLNTSLTVRQGTPDSHKSIWMEFVTKVIRLICETHKNCIFVCWGKKAQAMEKFIMSKYILRAAHPSGYSANNGFFGCNHFPEINQILAGQGKTPIDWDGFGATGITINPPQTMTVTIPNPFGPQSESQTFQLTYGGGITVGNTVDLSTGQSSLYNQQPTIEPPIKLSLPSNAQVSFSNNNAKPKLKFVSS